MGLIERLENDEQRGLCLDDVEQRALDVGRGRNMALNCRSASRISKDRRYATKSHLIRLTANSLLHCGLKLYTLCINVQIVYNAVNILHTT